VYLTDMNRGKRPAPRADPGSWFEIVIVPAAAEQRAEQRQAQADER
jgi:hypothetical protein